MIDLSEKLVSLTAELLEVEQELKSEQTTDPLVLQQFRTALDNARLAAWTVCELQMVRENRTDPKKIIEFLAGERIRRFTQMAADVYFDIEKQKITHETSGIQLLTDTLKSLISRLGQLASDS